MQEAGWAPGRFWTVAKNLVHTGIRLRIVQPVASRYTAYGFLAHFVGRLVCYTLGRIRVLISKPAIGCPPKRLHFKLGHETPSSHYFYIIFYLFLSAATAQRGPGLPHARGFLITHNDTPVLVGILWTKDRPVAETLSNSSSEPPQFYAI